MKLTTAAWLAVLTLSTLAKAGDSYGQGLTEARLTVNLRNVTLKEALQTVSAQVNLPIVYSDSQVPAARLVSLRATNQPLDWVLSQLLRPLALDYVAVGGQIIVKPAASPEGLVKGRVTDLGTGEVLPGVSVVLKGTQFATATDADGRYSIDVPVDNGTLVFSFIGYVPEEVAVGQRTVIDVALAPSVESLNQLVVVGYGTQRRADVTGAIATVSEKELKSVAVAGLDQMLQGQVAGVQVTQTSGQPGGGVAVRVRGVTSISAGNEPLYVIDGVPFYNWNTTFNQGPAGIFGTGQVSNALSVINPGDVESMTVLKDAAAAAIYGSRAANGVVLITTKRGKSGKGRVAFESYYGIQAIAKQIPVLNSPQYVEYTNEARRAAGLPPLPELANPAGLGVNTNWQDQVFQTAPIQNYQLSISGGNDQTQYAVSGGFFDQQGTIKVSGYRRFNFRVNLDQKVSDKFKIGTSITINNATNVINRAFGNAFDGQGGIIYGALLQPPIVPVFEANGEYGRPRYANFSGVVNGVNYSGNNAFARIDNPLASAQEYWHPINTTRLIGSFYAEYALLKNLKFRTSVSLDANYLKNNIFIPTRTGTPPPSAGAGFAFASQELVWLNENTLTWQQRFGENHSLTAVVGQSTQGASFERMISRVFNFPNDLVQTTNGGQTDLTNSFREEWKLISFLARVNYDYHDKYLLSVAMRTDGSSRFGPGRRFGYFPSVSAGWRISQESFLRESNLINELKLRASYGLTGNAEIVNTVNSFAAYAHIGGVGPANYAFGSVAANGLAPTRLPNRDLGWESTAQWNLGLDASLWKGRVSLMADAYDKTTNDMLLNGTPLPFTSGFSDAIVNIGRMRNRGWELTLNTVNLDRAVRWNTSFNVSFNRNTVLNLQNLAGLERIIPSGNSQTVAGQPIGQFFGFVADGIIQSQEELNRLNQNARTLSGNPTAFYSNLNTAPGDIRFRDLDANGIIDQNDRTYLGNPLPDYIYGLTNTISYEGLELSIFLQGVQGNQVYNQTRQNIESMTGGQTNQSARVLSRWVSAQVPGNGTVPRAIASDPNNNSRFSTRWIEDGSFLRVRNVTLAYSLPQAWLKPLRLASVRLYGSAQNVFTFTRYLGYDPEFSRASNTNLNPIQAGYDDSNYPLARTYLFGLNVTL